MTLGSRDKEFRHPGVSCVDFKQLDMDRVLTAFLARLWHRGYPSRVTRSGTLSVDDFVEALLQLHALDGFDRDVTRRWAETHLIDMVNRGKANQAVAGLRPLHGFTYLFRNSRNSRPYGADEQLYEMFAHARSGVGGTALNLLRDFFFTGIDPATESPESGSEIDVETQALLHLADKVRDTVEDRADTGKPRSGQTPLCLRQADLLTDDVLRLLYHKEHMPRSVMVEYLKTLFAFHLALYHLRLIKTLPALVSGVGAKPACGLGRCPAATPGDEAGCAFEAGMFVDVVGDARTGVAELATHSARIWYQRIPEFVRATFTVKKLHEFADNLTKKNKLRPPDGGTFDVPSLLRLLDRGYAKDRETYFQFRLDSVLEDADGASEGELPPEISQLLALDLDQFTSYIEVLTAYRSDFHTRYITQCLDSLLLKGRPGALLAQTQGRHAARRFILDSRLIEVLLQVSLLQPGGCGGFRTAPLRVDEFLDVLRRRYGLYVDRLPPDGFERASIADEAALRSNTAAFVSRLRETGFYTDLSDAYLTQTITPRYEIGDTRTLTSVSRSHR